MTLGLWGIDPANLGSADAIVEILTRSGAAAATVLSAEFEHRFPSTSSAGLRQDLAAAFDERLRLLARRATWIRGAS
jgi:hypothetical protein